MRARTRHDLIAWAVALFPFALLAIVDVRIPGAVLLWVLVSVSACAGPHLYFRLRFRKVKPADIPLGADVPRRLILTRGVLPLATMTIAFALLIAPGLPGDRVSVRVGVAAAVAVLSWGVANWLWRRWARSLGFDADAVLASIYRADPIGTRRTQTPAA